MGWLVEESEQKWLRRCLQGENSEDRHSYTDLRTYRGSPQPDPWIRRTLLCLERWNPLAVTRMIAGSAPLPQPPTFALPFAAFIE